jgi:hypothetical protein
MSPKTQNVHQRAYKRTRSKSELPSRLRVQDLQASHPTLLQLRSRGQEPPTKGPVAGKIGRPGTRRTPLPLKSPTRSARALTLARLGLEEAPCAEGNDPISASKVTTTLTERVKFQTKSTKAGNIGQILNVIPPMMAGDILSHRTCGPQRLPRTVLRKLSRTT